MTNPEPEVSVCLTTILYIIAKTVQIALMALLHALFLRTILSFFLDPEESTLLFFLALLTEPIIFPMRVLFDHFRIAQDSPIDFAYFASYFLLTFTVGLLPTI